MKKILNRFKILSIFSLIILLSGCNKEEEEISAGQIRQALFDMKGTYHGNIKISYYHGSEIVKIDNAKSESRDSLSFMVPLAPIAGIIEDEKVAATLREIQEVEIKAGYKFIQIDGDGDAHFVLNLKNITIPANKNTSEIKIILAKSFGGDFVKASNFMMFNISPQEIMVGDSKLSSFKQLVYHFSGEYQ